MDVWFGTDPNKLDTLHYTKVVTASEDASSVTVTAPPTKIYYWQVDSYIYGDPAVVDYDINGTDPNKYPVLEGDVWTFFSVSDVPPTVEIDDVYLVSIATTIFRQAQDKYLRSKGKKPIVKKPVT